jgi:hypothetical protein
MHFVISWEIKSGDKQRSEINDAMLAGLAGYPWIRLLSAFYVLEIRSDQDWLVIHEKLLAIARQYGGRVNFLMSPIYEFDSDYFVYQMPNKDFYRT